MSIGYDDGNLFSFLEAAQHNGDLIKLVVIFMFVYPFFSYSEN